MNKKIIGFGLIGFGIFSLLNSEKSNKKYFQLPTGGVVEESELPALGYIKFSGNWINSFSLQNLYNQSPYSNPSSGFNFQSFQNNLNTVFGSVTQLQLYFQQVFPASNSSDLLLGDPSGDYSGFA